MIAGVPEAPLHKGPAARVTARSVADAEGVVDARRTPAAVVRGAEEDQLVVAVREARVRYGNRAVLGRGDIGIIHRDGQVGPTEHDYRGEGLLGVAKNIGQSDAIGYGAGSSVDVVVTIDKQRTVRHRGCIKAVAVHPGGIVFVLVDYDMV